MHHSCDIMNTYVSARSSVPLPLQDRGVLSTEIHVCQPEQDELFKV